MFYPSKACVYAKYMFVFILKYKALKNHLYCPLLSAADKEGIKHSTKHKFSVRLTGFFTHSCLCSIQYDFTFWVAKKIRMHYCKKDSK